MLFIKLFSKKIPTLYDKNITHRSKKNFQMIIINMAMLSFLAHIFLVFLINHVDSLSVLKQLVPNNYLAAIYTPFSFILIYEIFELVIAIPQSITHFISKQYEIISLIFIRDVFKDMAHLDDLTLNHENVEVFKEIAMDLGTGLLLFLLLVVFNHINKFRERFGDNREVRTFINVKKSLSLILGIGLLGLAIYSLFDWAITGLNVISHGANYHQPLKLVFFKDFFTVLVFTDIFLMIFSLIYTKSYDVIFRNAAFIISTILIRLSLTSVRPLNIYVALLALGVGIFTSLIFVYYNKISPVTARTIGPNKEVL
jgi:hypothetical protein